MDVLYRLELKFTLLFCVFGWRGLRGPCCDCASDGLASRRGLVLVMTYVAVGGSGVRSAAVAVALESIPDCGGHR